MIDSKGSDETPLPAKVKSELEKICCEIEQLETQKANLNLAALGMTLPYLKTREGCQAALDCVPTGFVSYKVRQALDGLGGPPDPPTS